MNRARLRETLRQAEGIRRQAYDDKTGMTLKPGTVLVGTPSIGCGHNLLVPLSDAAIDFLLEEDIAAAEQALTAELPWWQDLDEVRQRTLCEMSFQLGIGALLQFKQTLALIRVGNYEDAAAGMLASKWFGQCPSRVRRLAQWMRTGTAEAREAE
jgi:lysozyme